MHHRAIIMGAAGRDFHDFLTFFRDNPGYHVVCFTAEQIPFIDRRAFPRQLAGPRYDADIPIYPESQLAELIEAHDIDFVFLSYSDLSHAEVMHKASLVQAAGASFGLLGPRHNQLVARMPVVSVTAVRTGAGKSPLSQAVARHLAAEGHRVGILRHPMPYGDLAAQSVQRFAAKADLETHHCSIEEREEYEPYLDHGMTIFAGVDYAGVLSLAEKDCDVVLWDGGNNDLPFIRPDLSLVVVDALRPGHEFAFYPGETNFRAADVLVLNKVSSADSVAVAQIRARAATLNPRAAIVEADLVIEVDAVGAGAIRGARVLVVEDGPTLTHGGMTFGAGTVAARVHGAAEIIDPRPFAVGSIADALAAHPRLVGVLPALGYSDDQRRELVETINAARPDLVVDGSPARLRCFLDIDVPLVEVGYRFVQRAGPDVMGLVDGMLADIDRFGLRGKSG